MSTLVLVLGFFLEIKATALHRRHKGLVCSKPKRARSFLVLKAAFALDGSGFTHQAEMHRAATRHLLAAETLQLAIFKRLPHHIFAAFFAGPLKIYIEVRAVL